MNWHLTVTALRRKNLFIMTGTWEGGTCSAQAKLSKKATPAEVEAQIEYLKELIYAFGS